MAMVLNAVDRVTLMAQVQTILANDPPEEITNDTGLIAQETNAINACLTALAPLPLATRAKVLGYLTKRSGPGTRDAIVTVIQEFTGALDQLARERDALRAEVLLLKARPQPRGMN